MKPCCDNPWVTWSFGSSFIDSQQYGETGDITLASYDRMTALLDTLVVEQQAYLGTFQCARQFRVVSQIHIRLGSGPWLLAYTKQSPSCCIALVVGPPPCCLLLAGCCWYRPLWCVLGSGSFSGATRPPPASAARRGPSKLVARLADAWPEGLLI